MCEESVVYHVYSRGNNQQQIFFKDENYMFFVEKLRNHILPYADILCYCLMPNHFHLQLVPNILGCQLTHPKTSTVIRLPQQHLTAGLRVVLSSYTQAINKQEKRTGSLFQQKIKSKIDWGGSLESGPIYKLNRPFVLRTPYIINCFHYIHNNPVKAGMVKLAKDWHFSSVRDYAGMRNNGICNFELAEQLLHVRRLPASG